MDATDRLAAYIAENIEAFQQIEVVGEGVGFHYTPHGDLIRSGRTFFGAPVGPNLAALQQGPISRPASDPDGVVFAYGRRETAVAEGRGAGMELFVIRFRRAVSAVQVCDAERHASIGLSRVPQLLILASEIIDFESLGIVENFYPKT